MDGWLDVKRWSRGLRSIKIAVEFSKMRLIFRRRVNVLRSIPCQKNPRYSTSIESALIELATSSSVTEKRRKCTLHFRVSRVSRLLAIVFKCNVLATYTYVRGTWLAIVAAPCTLTIIARSMHSIEDDKVHWYRFCANILISSSFSYCNYNVKCTYAFINFSILILRLRFRFVSIFNTVASFFFIASYIFRLSRIILFDIWYNHTTSLAQELKSLFF